MAPGFIKHLTSGQYSSGFYGHLNKARNEIMTGNKLMANKSKEQRKVIKQQTKVTKTSMTETIRLEKVIQMDSELFKENNQKSSFPLDIEFVRNVLCGPSTLDHEENLRMSCQCYDCEKHWKKSGGPPGFNPPRQLHCEFHLLSDQPSSLFLSAYFVV
ncbi:uncharacterized protein LOC110057620 isoform X2 [Orbicella faveolata]|uniref:uncharacterized protein LOC110057620 isoform X2 n=1 Tax=Orbicella faveolata TaxID=48498 RepID=UPI0009E3D50C|nr:uncharacterized protein LOC110057620 isoform X2 [Orbicella faveolata]